MRCTLNSIIILGGILAESFSRCMNISRLGVWHQCGGGMEHPPLLPELELFVASHLLSCSDFYIKLHFLVCHWGRDRCILDTISRTNVICPPKPMSLNIFNSPPTLALKMQCSWSQKLFFKKETYFLKRQPKATCFKNTGEKLKI